MDGYGPDLSGIHDAAFGMLAEAGGELLVAELGDRRDGPVIDLGCGGGITAEILVRAGHRVIGMDLSPAQVELARERAPEAELSVASFVDAELPEGSLAIALIGEVLNYAFDLRNDAGRLREFLARAHDALLPGGLLLFDLAEPGRVPDPPPPATHREGDGWAITYATWEVPSSPPMVVREIKTITRDEGGLRTEEEKHHLLLYPRAEVTAVLEEVGFELEVRPGYTDGLELPGLPVYLARKPG